MKIIKEINCDQPRLPKVNMTCDNDIHEKLNKYPLTKECFNKYCSTAFVGKQGSGKTSLMVNFVQKLYNKCFENVFVFMPSSSRDDLKDNIFDKRLPPENLYEDLNEENINEIYARVLNNKNEDEKTLLIFDDCQAMMKNKYIQPMLIQLIANQRHLNLCMFFLVQNYIKIPPSVRDLIHNYVVFNQGKRINKRVFDELLPITEDEFLQINELVYKKPHDWLMIDTRNKTLWNKFNRIVLDET